MKSISLLICFVLAIAVVAATTYHFQDNSGNEVFNISSSGNAWLLGNHTADSYCNETGSCYDVTDFFDDTNTNISGGGTVTGLINFTANFTIASGGGQTLFFENGTCGIMRRPSGTEIAICD